MSSIRDAKISKNNGNDLIYKMSCKTYSQISEPAAALVNPFAIFGKKQAYN